MFNIFRPELKTQPAWIVNEPPKKDVLQVVLSDTHSGSNYALFVGRNWQGTKENTHYPSAKQIKIRERFEIFADEVAQARNGKQVRLIHNGDALDGDHHHSGDVCTVNTLEQAEIHVEIMQEFQKRIGWQRGDEIYYTRGTQTHVNDMENWIGEQMNAVMDGEYYFHDLLKLETNGVMSWFVHHGPGAGVGPNEGNALRNWLRNIYFDALKDGLRPPDIVYSGHTHTPNWQPYAYRTSGFIWRSMHGIILPSWQMKTAYAWQKAPVNKNRIGGVIHEIKADGTVTIPRFSVMESD